MQKLTSKEIRQMWLSYWESKGHEIVASKSLIPVNDPSLLWINSGVATLKDYFSGKKIPSNPRITNSQKSIRTNDIENVGVTARHHTLFEMLGNFSIGDYFKQEVLGWAYELLFNVFKFDKDKIYFTYFDEDQDAYNRWIELGVDPSHMIRGGRDTNFWDVGSGPCGPCTEIFYDRGEKYDPEHVGLRLLKEDLENDRYVEIWNIVFSQFNNDGTNHYEELKQKNIDTGAGLERIVSVFQDAPTNFDTDLFQPIIKAVESMTGSHYDIENYFRGDKAQERINKNFRVIADHIRAVSLAIEDGAKPSNTQRGYIIRRLIRRAYRSGLLLGAKDDSFLYKLVPVVAEVMDVYPIDVEKVSAIIRKEELAFAKTIRQGEELLNKELENTKDEFNAEVAFKLFETYGFPIELTSEILEEKGIKLDASKFVELQEKHAEASRGKTVAGMDVQIQVIQEVKELQSSFVGYETLETKSSVLFKGEEAGKTYVLLDKTPFYPTGGGQAHDLGTIDGYDVINVFKDKFGNVWHVLNDDIEAKEVTATVDSSLRLRKERNHSATHLLGFALRQVFGNQVVQLGSDNNENRLRFDFPLEKRPEASKLEEVESIVNSLINKDSQREYILTTFDKGKALGAVTLEGEDYGDNVRVVKFDDSIEFCGGTHIENLKQIEGFKITRFESKGSGVFRIEAITGNAAIKAYEDKQVKELQDQLEQLIAKNVKLDASYKLEVPSTIVELNKAIDKVREDNKELNKSKANVAFDTNVEFTTFNGMKAYINLNFDAATAKTVAINLREAHKDALIILASTNNGRSTVAVASKAFNSKEIFDSLASTRNGRGGGNAEFAMGSMDELSL